MSRDGADMKSVSTSIPPWYLTIGEYPQDSYEDPSITRMAWRWSPALQILAESSGLCVEPSGWLRRTRALPRSPYNKKKKGKRKKVLASLLPLGPG